VVPNRLTLWETYGHVGVVVGKIVKSWKALKLLFFWVEG